MGGIELGFFYDKGGGLIACAKHALILIGLGVLFLPAMALGQAQTPEIHTGVSPWTLSNSEAHSEQGVISNRLVLSYEQSEANRPFEGSEDHDTVRHASIPRGAKSATTEIQMHGDGTDDKRSTVAVDGSKLDEKAVVSGNQKGVATRSKDNNRPRVCLDVSSEYVPTGGSVFVKATVEPVQQNDIEVTIDFNVFSDFFNPDIFDDPIRKTKSITIPAGSPESASFQLKTRWNGDVVLQSRPVFIVGSVPLESDHVSCLCPVFQILAPSLVRLSASPNPVEEGQPVTITASILRVQPRNITVPLNYLNAQTTDTAVDPDDYTSLPSITIKADTRRGVGEIQTHEADTDYHDKTFTVAIDENQLPVGIGITSPSSVEVTINDDDVVNVRF